MKKINSTSTSSLPGELQRQDEVDTTTGIICTICFEEVSLPELALLGSCEHGYCVICILQWASGYGIPAVCPQCKAEFYTLHVHIGAEGSIIDHMVEVPVLNLLNPTWIKPAKEPVQTDRVHVDVALEDEPNSNTDNYHRDSTGLRRRRGTVTHQNNGTILTSRAAPFQINDDVPHVASPPPMVRRRKNGMKED